MKQNFDIQKILNKPYEPYVPVLISSPSMRADDKATKIRDNGLNMGGYRGPWTEMAHESKQNVAAVFSAPYAI